MLTFKTDQILDEFIKNSKKKIGKKFPFCGYCIIAYSFVIFKKQGSILDNTYILSEVLLLVVLGGVNINQIISLSKTINNTAEEISFADNLITIKTYPFDFFSITNKKVQTLTINTNKIFVKKAPYPIPGGSKESVWVFAVNNLNIFIMLNNLPSDFTAIFLEQKKASEILN